MAKAREFDLHANADATYVLARGPVVYPPVRIEPNEVIRVIEKSAYDEAIKAVMLSGSEYQMKYDSLMEQANSLSNSIERVLRAGRLFRADEVDLESHLADFQKFKGGQE